MQESIERDRCGTENRNRYRAAWEASNAAALRGSGAGSERIRMKIDNDFLCGVINGLR